MKHTFLLVASLAVFVSLSFTSAAIGIRDEGELAGGTPPNPRPGMEQQAPTVTPPASAPAPVVRCGPKASVLQFRNGDELRGELVGITSAAGVAWRHPAAKAPLPFELESIAQITLQGPPAVSARPSVEIGLGNGDSLRGDLVSLDAACLRLATGSAGTVTVQRETLGRLTSLTVDGDVSFATPQTLDGWKRSPPATVGPVCTACHKSTPAGTAILERWQQSPPILDRWQLANGVFTDCGPGGFLARDVNLPDRARIEFELSWEKTLDLQIGLYSKDLAFTFGNRSDKTYWCYLRTGGAVLQRSTPSEASYLGPVAILQFAKPGLVRVAILTDKAQRSITLMIDDKPVKTWVDLADLGTEGSGLVLNSLGSCLRGKLRLADLRVRRWVATLRGGPAVTHD